MSVYTASDVAACIITTANETNRSRPTVSNLYLQKMLFFCQRDCLKKFNKPLFSDDIVAWQYGPVVKKVYHTYSYRGASPIEKPVKYLESFRGERTPIKELSGDARDVVSDVVKRWKDKPVWDLVQETHKVGGAWYQVYNRDGEAGSGFGEVIPIDLIKQEASA